MSETRIIRPPKSIAQINFKELWDYRELFYTLAWRDIKVRYKQTFIGAVWAMLQPFVLMVVFSVFFGQVAGLAQEGIPYPIFVFTGLLFWNLFSNSLSASSDSLVSNQAMLQKIYFPRVILPISTMIVFLVDFFFASLIMIVLMIYYGFAPTVVGIVLIIPALFITVLSSAGLGLALASINVKYRDVRYVLPFFVQILLFITPVIYPPDILGEYQWLWFLSPMAGVVDTMRAGMLGIDSIDWQLLGGSFLVSLVFLISGVTVFNKTEKYFADIV